MNCNCKNIEPLFLQAIYRGIYQTSAPGEFGERRVLLEELEKLAKECGYEKDEKGNWVQFPKQDKALESLGVPFEIVKEHDDGDLTIRIPQHNACAVVTTEGEVFTKAGEC